MALLQKIRNFIPIRNEGAACIISTSVTDDIKILSKYREGATVANGDEEALYRLASIGLARMGTDVILDGRKFHLKPTAKATTLGKKIIQAEI